jgi:hypothetical protein
VKRERLLGQVRDQGVLGVGERIQLELHGEAPSFGWD